MSKTNLFQRFIKYYKPHLNLFILDMFCAFLVAGLELFFPAITRNYIGESGFIKNSQIKLILLYGILLFGLYVIHTIARYIMAYWGHMVGVRMEFDMRSDLYRHIQGLDVEYFDNNKTGQIMSRLTHDLRDITELAHHGPEDLFISVIMLIGTFIYMMTKHLLFTLIIYTVLALMIWFAVSKRKSLLKAFKKTRKKHAEINAHLESSISGIRLCKSYANESYEMSRFYKQNVAYRDSYYDAYREMAQYASGTTFFLNMVTVVALVLGGWFAYKGWISVEILIVFILYTTMFTSPIRRLVQFTQQFQQGFSGFSRFAEIMDIKPKIKDKPNAKKLKNPKGKIEIKNVSFRYGENNPWILRDFDLKIQPGKTVALVGPTGVGKTTITHLIPRFYDINKGEVLVDGISIKDIEIKTLRENIGLVQQDVIVFYGSIKENILYGKPDATDEEIQQAAIQANIHNFIMSLPDQYDSIVGERGIKLSGGQKQRLSLARVFLQNPPILILDEATSSLDNATELAIKESIEKLAKNRTSLVVAHRLSTIKNADEILVITKKGIEERGNHEQLMAKNGVYASLYKAQFQGYVPKYFPNDSQ